MNRRFDSNGDGASAEEIHRSFDLLRFATPVLINMVNRPERLQDSLEDIGSAAGRPVSADVDVHMIRPRQFDDPGGFANTGFRSNLDAHLRAARWARDTEVERLLVLEDDLSFGPAWTRHGARLMTELADRDWHFASLGYLDVWNEAPGIDALDVHTEPAEPESADTESADADAGWVRFAGQVNGAHAYLVNSNALDRWIAHLELVADGTPGDDLRGPMPSDGAINTFAWINPDIVRVLAVPNMVGTRPTRSDITPSVVDRLPIVGDVAEHLRGWRRRRHGSKVANFK